METSRVNPEQYSYRQLALLYLGWLAISFWIFLYSWVAEDAYITFRVVDNVVNGYGLRWNIHERVQVYTHPLWMLLHIPFYWMSHNIFLTTIFLSFFCSMTALIVALNGEKKPALIVLGCFFLPLLLSRAFIDYATSGLETPLSFLLYACFGYVLLRLDRHKYFWFYCSLTVALALFNRLDSIFLYLPVLLALVFPDWRQVRWRQIFLGALPLILWLAFALFYYGFIFPNTKYAKLDTGLSTLSYLKQGFHYFKYLMTYDTVSGLMLFWPLVIIVTAVKSPRWRGLPLMLSLGVYCYMFYIIWIGGDYMAGRFWALPVFASAWLFYLSMPTNWRPDIPFAVLCLLLAAYQVPGQLYAIREICPECTLSKSRIIDARSIFFANMLVRDRWPFRIRKHPHYGYLKYGKELAKKNPPTVEELDNIGLAGFYAGPKPILIDPVGLADPLLARLPARQKQSFYIGHFRRRIPPGYLEAIKTGNTDAMAPALAEYYKKLRLITSGDLTDPERLKTIVEFNLGRYDKYRDDFTGR